ncbi:MAG: hypothetical protein AB8B96_16710, partial [Lysobacterales bacterium]
KPDGESWAWYEDGKKFKVSRFNMGQPLGLQQAWRKNGKLFRNFEMRNGRLYGLNNANLCLDLEGDEAS